MYFHLTGKYLIQHMFPQTQGYTYRGEGGRWGGESHHLPLIDSLMIVTQTGKAVLSGNFIYLSRFSDILVICPSIALIVPTLSGHVSGLSTVRVVKLNTTVSILLLCTRNIIFNIQFQKMFSLFRFQLNPAVRIILLCTRKIIFKIQFQNNVSSFQAPN